MTPIARAIGLIFGIPFMLLIFACPVLEISKLELFNRTNGVLKYDTNVEYTYLVLSLIAPSALILVYFFKCNYTENFSPMTIKVSLLVYLLSSIGISIAYTVFTIHELGSIPFGCPNDHSSYATPLVQTACQARAANFVSMWAFVFFLILNILLLILGVSPLNEVDIREPKSTQPRLRDNEHPYIQIELNGQKQEG